MVAVTPSALERPARLALFRLSAQAAPSNPPAGKKKTRRPYLPEIADAPLGSPRRKRHCLTMLENDDDLRAGVGEIVRSARSVSGANAISVRTRPHMRELAMSALTAVGLWRRDRTQLASC